MDCQMVITKSGYRKGTLIVSDGHCEFIAVFLSLSIDTTRVRSRHYDSERAQANNFSHPSPLSTSSPPSTISHPAPSASVFSSSKAVEITS
jgi:hypothetical protein